MRTTTVKLAALLALLLGGAVMGEPADDIEKPKKAGDIENPKKPAEEKKPSQLEELIAQALRDNPDIRVAEAKTREAEAELSRVRLQVIQKVVAHQHTVETLEGAVKVAEANYRSGQAKLKFAEAQLKRMTDSGLSSSPNDLDEARTRAEQARADVSNAQAALQSAKADLAKAQAELPYLLGKGNKDDKDSAKIKDLEELLKLQREQSLYALSLAEAHGIWQKEMPRGSVAEKLRKALGVPASVNIKVDDQPLSDILEYLGRLTDVPVVTNKLPREILVKKMTVDVKNISVPGAFQLVEDLAGVQFGVREYGLLVTDKLPSGVTSLHDFWKDADKPKAGEEKPK